MKLRGFAVLLALFLVVPTSLLDAQSPIYRARVWTTDGHIWTLDITRNRSGYGEWRYWAPGESGDLRWEEVDWISFQENLHPHRYGAWNREIPHGQRVHVKFNNGERRELYVDVSVLTGIDAWGPRRALGSRLARIDFLETRNPRVLRCPNGHVWADEGYRFCPYDGQPVTPYDQY